MGAADVNWSDTQRKLHSLSVVQELELHSRNYHEFCHRRTCMRSTYVRKSNGHSSVLTYYRGAKDGEIRDVRSSTATCSVGHGFSALPHACKWPPVTAHCHQVVCLLSGAEGSLAMRHNGNVLLGFSGEAWHSKPETMGTPSYVFFWGGEERRSCLFST